MQVDTCSEKVQCTTKKYDADIETFTAFDAGHKPNERIIIGVGRVHVWPPPQSIVRLPGGLAGMPDMPHDAHHGLQRMGQSSASYPESNRPSAVDFLVTKPLS